MSQGKRMRTEDTATSKKGRKDNKALDTFFKLIAFAYVVITIIFYIKIKFATRLGNNNIYNCRNSVYISNGNRFSKET